MAAILIVEDDPLQAEALKLQLAECGYLISAIGSDGEMALYHRQNERTANPGQEQAAKQLTNELMQAEDELRLAIATLQDTKRRLESSESRYKALIGQAADALFVFDMDDGRFVEVNHQASDSLGYGSDELLQMCVSDISPGHDLAARRLVWSAFELGRQYKFIATHQRKDGSIFPVELHLSALEIEGKKLGMAVVRDISERKQVKEKLELTQYVTDHAPDSILWIDEQARICYVNEAVCREHGYTKDELLAMSIPDFDPEFPAEAWPAHWQELKQKGSLTFETRHTRKDGSIFPVEVCANYVKFGDKEFNVAYNRDITERKRVEDEIRNLAFHDMLTGLPNRRLLEDRLDQAMATSKRSGNYGAVIFLDLDNFKPLNDTHGHKAGDLLLVEVAQRLVLCVREVDTVARFGGDEFVVVLSELIGEESECAAQANIVAEKILSVLAEPYWLAYNAKGTSKMILHNDIGASIGVALFNNIAIAENILKWADSAMYQAKNAGRNQVRFYEATA